MVYISPSFYNLYYVKENRNISVLTTFIAPNVKRNMLITELREKGVDHTNVNDCFDKNALCELYKNTRVLVNIHQTYHNHTFEEIRVLPALQCGVLTICENSPLRECIPYTDYIIWSPLDKIVEKTAEVIANYDYYFDEIFGNTVNKQIQLCDLHATNYENLERTILNAVYTVEETK